MSMTLLGHLSTVSADLLVISYGSYLDSSCRLHYSRLCNLLLKRGKISPKLKDLTTTALGSDSEKESFFLEYEMTDQLFKFYIDKQNYLDAFNLAIKNAHLDRAWQVIKTHGGVYRFPKKQEIEVFNYAQMNRVLANLATEPERIFLSDIDLSQKYPWLPDNSSIQEFWIKLEQNIVALFKREVSYTSINFAEKWMKQLFDIIVSRYIELVPPTSTDGHGTCRSFSKYMLS